MKCLVPEQEDWECMTFDCVVFSLPLSFPQEVTVVMAEVIVVMVVVTVAMVVETVVMEETGAIVGAIAEATRVVAVVEEEDTIETGTNVVPFLSKAYASTPIIRHGQTRGNFS